MTGDWHGLGALLGPLREIVRATSHPSSAYLFEKWHTKGHHESPAHKAAVSAGLKAYWAAKKAGSAAPAPHIAGAGIGFAAQTGIAGAKPPPAPSGAKTLSAEHKAKVAAGVKAHFAAKKAAQAADATAAHATSKPSGPKLGPKMSMQGEEQAQSVIAGEKKLSDAHKAQVSAGVKADFAKKKIAKYEAEGYVYTGKDFKTGQLVYHSPDGSHAVALNPPDKSFFLAKAAGTHTGEADPQKAVAAVAVHSSVHTDAAAHGPKLPSGEPLAIGDHVQVRKTGTVLKVTGHHENGVGVDLEVVSPGTQSSVSAGMKINSQNPESSKMVKVTPATDAVLHKSDGTPMVPAEVHALAHGAPAEHKPDGFPVTPTALTSVKGLGGSTGAMLAQDAVGNKFVVKHGSSNEHVAAEHGANEVYRAAGVTVPEGKLYDGTTQVTKFVEGGKQLGQLHGAELEAAHAELRKHFVLDAIMGNHDVIGQNADNVLVTPDGKVHRVDNGGSFDFRAQGEKKAYGADVTALTSMRDPAVNPQTAKVYGKLTPSEVLDQAISLYAKKAALVAAAPEQYRKVLGERIDDALKKATAEYNAHTAASTKIVGGVEVKAGAPGSGYGVGQNPASHPTGGAASPAHFQGVPVQVGDTLTSGIVAHQVTKIHPDGTIDTKGLKDTVYGVTGGAPHAFDSHTPAAPALTMSHVSGTKLIGPDGKGYTVTGAAGGQTHLMPVGTLQSISVPHQEVFDKYTKVGEGNTGGAKVPAPSEFMAGLGVPVGGHKIKAANGDEVGVGDHVSTGSGNTYKVVRTYANGRADLELVQSASPVVKIGKKYTNFNLQNANSSKVEAPTTASPTQTYDAKPFSANSTAAKAQHQKMLAKGRAYLGQVNDGPNKGQHLYQDNKGQVTMSGPGGVKKLGADVPFVAKAAPTPAGAPKTSDYGGGEKAGYKSPGSIERANAYKYVGSHPGQATQPPTNNVAIASGIEPGHPILSPSFHQKWNEAMATLPPAERQVVGSFTGSGSGSMNSHLIHGGAPTQKTRTLDSALSRHTTDRDLVTYRGVHWSGFDPAKATPGSIIPNPNFSSSTTNKEREFPGNVRFRIEVPKGTSGAWVKSVSSVSSEDEWLIPRGAQFRVKSITQEHGYHRVNVEIVGFADVAAGHGLVVAGKHMAAPVGSHEVAEVHDVKPYIKQKGVPASAAAQGQAAKTYAAAQAGPGVKLGEHNYHQLAPGGKIVYHDEDGAEHIYKVIGKPTADGTIHVDSPTFGQQHLELPEFAGARYHPATPEKSSSVSGGTGSKLSAEHKASVSAGVKANFAKKKIEKMQAQGYEYSGVSISTGKHIYQDKHGNQILLEPPVKAYFLDKEAYIADAAA